MRRVRGGYATESAFQLRLFSGETGGLGFAAGLQLGIEAGETTPDGKFSIQDTRCLGCCGLAPVMTVDGDVYGRLTPADVKDILAKY